MQPSYCIAVRAVVNEAPIEVDGPTALDDDAVFGEDIEPGVTKSRKCFFLK
jgi:hypothetical protein